MCHKDLGLGVSRSWDVEFSWALEYHTLILLIFLKGTIYEIKLILLIFLKGTIYETKVRVAGLSFRVP